MSTPWNTIRVFISSTFKDMQAERDHLVRFVFPKLREELLKWRVHLEDVDLRWGVTSDQDAFDLCMKEIDLCHPRFICMLGWRYGWVPPPKEIPAEIFAEVLAGTSAAGKLKSSEDEALRSIYSPIKVGGNFLLKPKPKTTDELNAYRAHCEVAVSALQRAGHDDAKRSITASEIHHGALERLNTPAFRSFYIRKGNPTAKIPAAYIEKPGTLAVAYLDDLKAKIKNPATQSKVLLAPGHEELRPLTCHEYPWDWDEPTQRITQLEEFGRQVHADIIASVKAQFGDIPEYKPAVTDEDIFEEEAQQMEAFIEERTRPGRYVASSRDKLLLPKLETFAAADSAPNVLVLTGAPGSGKSAFLAKFVRSSFGVPPSGDPVRTPAFTRPEAPPEGGTPNAPDTPLILPHFIGVSAGSTDLRRTLRRLCHELAPLADNNEPLPQDIKELKPHFQKLLTDAAKKQRIILILDALNQLDTTDGAHWLNWLPSTLPANVRILASVITPPDGQPEHQTLAILRQRQARIEPLEPLKEHDSRAILTDFLDRYSKHLTEAQIAAILRKPDSHLPLYLLVILEELRTLGTDEQLTALSTSPIAPEELARLRRDDHDKILEIFIEKELPDFALELFKWILIKRLPQDQFLSKDPKEAADLVGKFAACLGVSRHGLSPAELAALLDPGDPLGNVAALLRLLRPYLMRRGELLDFYHGQFREAAGAAHLDTPEKQRAAHQSVATCLQAFADPHRDGQCRDATPHALSELPHHQTRAEAWPDIIATLENLFFLEAKATCGMGFDLVEDFTVVVERMPPKHPNRECFRLLDEALRRDIHFIASHAKDYQQALFQCLWNSCWWLDTDRHGSFFALDESQMWTMHEGQDYSRRPYLSVSNTSSAKGAGHTLAQLMERWRREKSNRTPGFVWLRSCRPPSVSIGSARSITIAIARDNAESTRETVRSLHFIGDTDRLLTGSTDGQVAVWDSNTGLRLSGFAAQSRGVCKMAVARKGEFVALSSWDGTIQVHDWRTGLLRQRIAAHPEGVTGIAASPHGHLLASFGSDKCINIWDRKTGARVARHPCASDVITIHDLTWGCDEHTLYFTDGFTVWKWDPQRSQPETVASKVISIESIACSPDGKCLACGSTWGPVVILDSSNGGLLHTMRGHAEGKIHTIGPVSLPSSQAVRSVVFSHDGKHVVSAGNDDTVRMWNVVTGLQEELFLGHDNYCWAVSLSNDGKKVASASEDATVRVWDRGTSVGGAVSIAHAAPIKRIAFSPDGKTIATCSEDCSIGVWGGLSGAPLAQLKGHNAGVHQIKWSPDSRFLLSWGTDSLGRIWDLTTKNGVFIKRDKGRSNLIGARCWLPGSGSTAVCSDAKGTIYTYDVGHGIQFRALRGHFKSVTAIAIVPQLELMAACSKDGTIWVCSLKECHEPVVLQTEAGKSFGAITKVMHVYWRPEFRKWAEEQGYRAVDLSPDGRLVVSVGDDGNGRIWDIQKIRELNCFHPLPRGQRAVFSPDGKLIVSCSIVSDFGDQKVEIWDAPAGTRIECLAGDTDIGVIAASPMTHPWIVLGGPCETVVISAKTRRPLAYYPSPLRNVSAHPADGHLWAGSKNHHLELLRIEQQIEESPQVKGYRADAENGDATAQNNLGLCIQNGTGIRADEAEAIKWYLKAADQGHTDAQNSLGWCLQKGIGVEKNEVEAVKWYHKAAEQGYAIAQTNLGWCYMNGVGVAEDKEAAVKWYMMAAAQGDATAQNNLGLCIQNGTGIRADEVEAIKWYLKAADQGHTDAQNSLGWCLQKGIGVEKNEVEAVKWYHKAAEQGYAIAQTNLGWCYMNGVGVAEDKEAAVKWYMMAAAQGDATAQNNLGLCIQNGTGIRADEAEAIKWYLKAADQGHTDAQNSLGWCLQKGIGVEKNEVEAVKWYHKAAEQGYAIAQTNLGWCYANGVGVAQDEEEGMTWYRKAADQGHSDALRCLRLMGH